MNHTETIVNNLTARIDEANSYINRPIINVVKLPVKFHTGTWSNHCVKCDQEITRTNPGKEIRFTGETRRHVVVICNTCCDYKFLESVVRNENFEMQPFEL